jgi:hypothetical protein
MSCGKYGNCTFYALILHNYLNLGICGCFDDCLDDDDMMTMYLIVEKRSFLRIVMEGSSSMISEEGISYSSEKQLLERAYSERVDLSGSMRLRSVKGYYGSRNLVVLGETELNC